MPFKQLLFFCVLISFACNNAAPLPLIEKEKRVNNSEGKNTYPFIEKIPLPEGFARIPCDTNSFGAWLRRIALKQDRTVYLFNGNKKANQSAQFAVLDISTGNKDLQQCADAVMRLRAEYLFAMKRYDQIIFSDNEKGVYKFTAPYSRQNFMQFLERVFGMCGSASLSKQLKTVNGIASVQPGDVLIRGGFPGHAAIVIDAAVNAAGKKIYLLAQGYMPAQDIHVLVNPVDENLNPWYKVNDDKNIITPEYVFYKNELKSW